MRAKNIQNACCVHGIIEFSNHCANDCAYCGLRRQNKGIRRYRMTTEEIIEAAEHAVKKLGFRALVLQSGEDSSYSDDDLVHIVSGIRGRCGVLLFMSVGERSASCYRRLYEAGAYGTLLRFETSNPKIYRSLHSGRELAPRLALIRKLKKMGFVLATGFLFGLPGQTDKDIAQDIKLTKSLEPDMVSLGPLIPHPSTPLAGMDKVSLGKALTVISVCRLAAPKSHIAVTTALETLDPGGRKEGLLAGGNSLMVDITPDAYRKDYDIYPGRGGAVRPVRDRINETLRLLDSLGRAPTDLR